MEGPCAIGAVGYLGGVVVWCLVVWCGVWCGVWWCSVVVWCVMVCGGVV